MVVEKDNHYELTDLLLRYGFLVSAQESYFKALRSLLHGRFAAICIDNLAAGDDLLDFILNARDIDPNIEVYIVGEVFDGNELKAIKKLTGVVQVETLNEFEELLKNE